MPSLHPGYAYDIFISYRHNDNLDGWVTEFVQSLEKELRATIKEPISIYFDQNPHDGLLESHHVDKSLEGKLKCLIFIPILSQTYCDPKSFAWQHEFCAFNRAAQNDALGRDIRLRNGNVASRILPVRIHDLDAQDQAMVEQETGSALRAIDFIYKEPGVNRPLKPGDSRDLNQNKTDYRNQVNKVANAVKELVASVKQPAETSKEKIQAPIATSSRKKPLVLTGTLLVVAAIIGGYLFYSNWFNQSKLPLDKSIAVLPFTDLSAEGNYQYFGDGLSDEVINTLSTIPELKVIARSSSFQFTNKDLDIVQIGKTLNVATILQGSVRSSGSRVRISAQLVSTKDASLIWSKTFDRNPDDVIKVQEEVSNQVAGLLKVTFSLPRTLRPWNEQAWKLYQEGRYFWDRTGANDRNKAGELFHQALKYDSTQPILYTFLAAHYSNQLLIPEAWKYMDKALQLDSTLSETIIIQSRMERVDLRFKNALRLTEKALANGRGSNLVLRVAARTYSLFGEHELAIQLARQAIRVDPLAAYSNAQLGFAFFNARQYDSVILVYRRVLELSPNFNGAHADIARAYLLSDRPDQANNEIELEPDEQYRDEVKCLIAHKKGNHQESLNILNRYIKLYGEQFPWNISTMYAYMNKPDEAIAWLRKSVASRHPFNELTMVDPFLDAIRDDPRYQEILKELGFPMVSR